MLNRFFLYAIVAVVAMRRRSDLPGVRIPAISRLSTCSARDELVEAIESSDAISSSSQSFCASGSSLRVHFGGTAGSDRDHWNPDWHVIAGSSDGQRSGASNCVRKQPSTSRTGAA